MKKITTLIVIVLISTFGFGQTNLSAGDVAITGYNVDGSDQIAFVLLRDVFAGTEIRFTDRGWLSTNNFRPGNPSTEGSITWIADTDLSCGTEVIITSPNTATPSATVDVGSISSITDDLDLSVSGDQILVFQGTDTSPTFLYAINFNAPGWITTGGASQQSSFIPIGLTDGVDSIDIGLDNDNGTYNCAVTTTPPLILQAVTDLANWTLSDGAGDQSLTLGLCTFDCSTVCPTSTIWDGTVWSNTTGPDLTIAAIIDGDYDTGVNGSFSACSVIVNTGNTLVVNNSTFVEIQGDATINGTLTVQTQGNFIQNDDLASFINNPMNPPADLGGQVLKSPPNKVDWFFYTYWSSPVSGLIVNDVFNVLAGDRMFRFGWNAANYQDVIINATGATGADGIDDTNDAFVALDGTEPLTPGLGYAITESENLFIPPAPIIRPFIGAFNNGAINITIENDPATVAAGGAHYNFLGNPYPSAISFDDFQAANATIIGPQVYYWSQATPPNAVNPGNQNSNFSQNDYAIYMVSMGVGTAGGSGVQPTEFIPSGQGFFVPSIGAGTATFNNSMRSNAITAGSNDIFFGIEEDNISLNTNTSKETNSNNLNNRNLLWLNLTTNNGVFNQALIGYVDGATDANDGLTYEATRILPFEPTGIIYTLIDGENTKLAIQGKAPSGLDETEIIPLGFDTDIPVSENTTYTLSVAQFEGTFFNTATIFLIDNLLGVSHNLSNSDYDFNSEVGEFQDRFEIRFEDVTLSAEEFQIAKNNLAIIELDNGDVQFRISNNFEMENIKIIDLTGRELYDLEASGSDNTYNLSGLNRASVYIAQVELTNGSVITKKAIKRN